MNKLMTTIQNCPKWLHSLKQEKLQKTELAHPNGLLNGRVLKMDFLEDKEDKVIAIIKEIQRQKKRADIDNIITTGKDLAPDEIKETLGKL